MLFKEERVVEKRRKADEVLLRAVVRARERREAIILYMFWECY